MNMLIFRALVVVIGVSTLGCGNAPSHTTGQQELASVAALPNNNLDILFVMDSSASMVEEQILLAQNFPRFMQQLEALPGGLPNVHIGVVTPDLGTMGGLPAAGCSTFGDGGALLLQGFATTDAKPFLSNIADASNLAVRNTNYNGNLTTAFAQLARVGSNGCGFEQPLEAMKRALTATNITNVGFLRDDAKLAIVIVTDEDDCSVPGPDFFSSNPALGPLDSYRCFTQGVICDDDSLDPQRAGERSNCRPRPNAVYQTEVTAYTDFLIARKGDERNVMVAGVIAPTLSSVSVDHDDLNQEHPTRLAAACERTFDGMISRADPAIRLTSFLNSFPGRTQTASICDADYGTVLTTLGASAARLIDAACLEQAPRLDGNDQPLCDVVQLSARSATGSRTEQRLKACNGSSDETCYRFVEDATRCAAQPSQWRLEVQRTRTATTQDYVVARCSLAE